MYGRTNLLYGSHRLKSRVSESQILVHYQGAFSILSNKHLSDTYQISGLELGTGDAEISKTWALSSRSLQPNLETDKMGRAIMCIVEYLSPLLEYLNAGGGFGENVSSALPLVKQWLDNHLAVRDSHKAGATNFCSFCHYRPYPTSIAGWITACSGVCFSNVFKAAQGRENGPEGGLEWQTCFRIHPGGQ